MYSETTEGPTRSSNSMEISSKNGIYPIVRVKKLVIVRNSYDFTLKSKVIEPMNLLGMLD